MDENKRLKLKSVGYTIAPVCGLCVHATFVGAAHSYYGECTIHRYEHRKHENPEQGRALSINRHGTCPSFEPHERRVLSLDGYGEFVSWGLTR